MIRMKKIISFLLTIFLLTGCANNPQPVSVSDPVPTSEPKQVHISLMAVGDNLIHGPIYREAAQRAKGKGFDFLPAYAPMKDFIQKADIAFLNQEVPLGGTELGLSSYPQFNSPQELGTDMISLGFDVINHATNHILDKGEAGLKNTINFWKGKNVLVLGINDGTIPAIQYLERDGVTFSFLSYVYGTNGLSLSNNSPYSISYIDKEKIKKEVQTARQTSDVVIVSMHWGTEYQMTANEEQLELAKLLASENVDLVIGHHPHVIEPMDTLKRSDGKDMVIAYSLGNFISSQNKSFSMLGGMLTVDFIGSKENIKISSPKFTPLVTHYEGLYKNTTVYPLPNYTKEMAARHGCKAFDNNFSLEYLNKLVHKTIDTKYLTE